MLPGSVPLFYPKSISDKNNIDLKTNREVIHCDLERISFKLVILVETTMDNRH